MRRISRAAAIKWFIVDDSTINSIDSTGAAMLEALSEDLRAQGYPARLCQPPEPRFEPCWNAPEYRLYSAKVRYSPDSNPEEQVSVLEKPARPLQGF